MERDSYCFALSAAAGVQACVTSLSASAAAWRNKANEPAGNGKN